MTLIPSSTAITTAHTGNVRRGGATLTSKSDGPLCRWRSLSDFFSASRMNDMMGYSCAAVRRGEPGLASAPASATCVLTPAMPSTVSR